MNASQVIASIYRYSPGPSTNPRSVWRRRSGFDWLYWDLPRGLAGRWVTWPSLIRNRYEPLRVLFDMPR